MLPCKSPLHAHPSFYLLTLFHLSYHLLSTISISPLSPSVSLFLFLFLFLFLSYPSLIPLLPLYCPFIAPLLSFFLFSALFFLFCVLLYRYTGLGPLQVSPNPDHLLLRGRAVR